MFSAMSVSLCVHEVPPCDHCGPVQTCWLGTHMGNPTAPHPHSNPMQTCSLVAHTFIGKQADGLWLKDIAVCVLWPLNTGFVILLRSIQGPPDDEEVRSDRHGRRVLPGGSHKAVVEQAASAYGPTVSITNQHTLSVRPVICSLSWPFSRQCMYLFLHTSLWLKWPKVKVTFKVTGSTHATGM